MAEKLSDRLWDLLNEATVRAELSATQLCMIDEARALAKRVEHAQLLVEVEMDLAAFIFTTVPDEWNGRQVRLLLEEK